MCCVGADRLTARVERAPERRGDERGGYNDSHVRFPQFAGIFSKRRIVRLASYHPLPARMTINAHPGGET
jgi:hypothetical protein